jgi:hypothetical protein
VQPRFASEVFDDALLYVGISEPGLGIAEANTLAQLGGESPFVGLQTE